MTKIDKHQQRILHRLADLQDWARKCNAPEDDGGEFMLRPTAMTLLEDGLVRRINVPKQRTVVAVAITEKGRLAIGRGKP